MSRPCWPSRSTCFPAWSVTCYGLCGRSCAMIPFMSRGLSRMGQGAASLGRRKGVREMMRTRGTMDGALVLHSHVSLGVVGTLASRRCALPDDVDTVFC